jgi:hypothetical protein
MTETAQLIGRNKAGWLAAFWTEDDKIGCRVIATTPLADLVGWAESRSLPVRVYDRNGTQQVKIGNHVRVTFGTTLPRIIVEWGDRYYRGDFSHGLPSAALTALVAGLLEDITEGEKP